MSGTRPYDVIVLGLGGMGSAAACHLSARGKRVLGLEQFQALHGNGSSHGDSRIIRQAYYEHPDYVPLALRAYELWHQLERDSGTRVLHQTGGLMIGCPGSSVVEGSRLSARRHGLAHEMLDAKELRRRFPELNPRPDELALYEPAAGYLEPETAIKSHLAMAVKHGAELHFDEPVVDWLADTSGGGVTVRTARANYEAESLVIAAGAWSGGVLEDLQIPFDVHRHVVCWFEPVLNGGAFEKSQFPIYIWEVGADRCFYGFPETARGQGVKAAMHSGGRACTASNVDRQVRDDDVVEVRDCLERFIPTLNGLLVKATTCLYTMTPDAHFVVSLHPKYPQVSMAAGFSGHGFKFTSVMGEILADLATDGKTKQPIEFLRGGRFGGW